MLRVVRAEKRGDASTAPDSLARSEEHMSDLQSPEACVFAVYFWKKKR